MLLEGFDFMYVHIPFKHNIYALGKWVVMSVCTHMSIPMLFWILVIMVMHELANDEVMCVIYISMLWEWWICIYLGTYWTCQVWICMIKNDMDYWFIYVNVMIDACVHIYLNYLYHPRSQILICFAQLMIEFGRNGITEENIFFHIKIKEW